MISRSHRRRVAASALLLFAGFVIVVVRLFSIQVIQTDRWSARARHMRTITMHRPRGPITDRRGNILALSVPVQSLFVDPAIMEDKDDAARRLAAVLNLDPFTLRDSFETSRRFVWVARHLDQDVVDRIRALRIRGVGFRHEYRRDYPNGHLAANLLGFVGRDGQGLEGIEFQHDAVLAAREGERLVISSLRGLELPRGDVVVREPEGGDILELTIDEVIQHLAERELMNLYHEWQPKSAFIIVTDPHTGDILACAVRPTFNPNDFSMYPAYTYKNRVVTDLYEPGSVFKVVPAAGALDDDRVTPRTSFNCPGFIKLFGITMGCTGVHGDVSVREIIEKSCNTGVAKIGRVLGPKDLYYYIRRFGFGERSDVELPGERVGIVRLTRQWSGLSTAAISMGQEIGVTGLQMMYAMGAIANGGSLMVPRIVRRVLSHDGHRVLRDDPPRIRRRVVSEGVAAEMRRMLGHVVVRGTGTRGRLEFYQAAGKTGTSQKLGAGPPGRYVVSFAGFVPVEKPRVAIYVVVNEPQGSPVSGGRVAAPAFRNLAGSVMIYLGERPEHLSESDFVDAAFEDEDPPPPPVRAVAVGDSIGGSPVVTDDPVAMDLDETLLPLPGPAGTGWRIERIRHENGVESFDDGEGEIGRIIDAAVFERDN